MRLAVPVGDPGYAEVHLAPDVFPVHHARYLDTFLANARQLEEAKRWLALLLVMKHALRLCPMGNFGAKTIMRQAAAGDWEEMNPYYVRDLNTRGVPRHPIRLAEILRKQVNAGVFVNGCGNEASHGDAFEFLAGVRGDVVYFDPPYSGTRSYERAFKPLDDLLSGGPQDVEQSPFSREAPERILPRLFEAADHIPT